MKFTEGYWSESERANALYATHAYIVREIDAGIQVVAPVKKVLSRGDTLNLPTITIDFVVVGENRILVSARHFEGYYTSEPRFELNQTECSYKVGITESEATLESGDITVRINREEWTYQFEAKGKVLTSCGFKNLGYIRWDKKASTMFPESNYLSSEYQPYMMTELSLGPGENIYGLGERFTSFVKNGQVVNTWNEDGGTSSQIAYKSIPFYLTNKGYGIFVDHTGNVSFEVASEKVEYVGFSIPGEELRYTFIYGPTPKEIISSYTEMTGRPSLPPAWSFGLWLTTSFTTNYSEETTSSFIQGMEERDIPLSVFHFDSFWMKEFQWCDFKWDERVFPDVKGMIERYHKRGLKICVWINPYVAQGTDFYNEGLKYGYFIQRADGCGPKQIDFWQTGMSLIDFTNPDACRWYINTLKTLLDVGVDCFKTDFGERIPIDVTYFDGSDPISMHNYYTYLYNKQVFEMLEQEKGENEAIIFARSATVGSQKFPVHWGGDSSANYPSMAETLRGGLSISMSGFSFWSHDISGFEQTATADLYKRWVAFGMFGTHSRLHGSTSYRVPWMFDEEANDVVRHFVKLKHRMMPYIYAKSIEATQTGIPVMRPMVMEFPNTLSTACLDMQYMLGDQLLVAPIFDESGEVEFYLPEGMWTHLQTGEVKQGGRWYKEIYDYFDLPLFIRENGVVVFGNTDERPDYEYINQCEIHLYAWVKDGECSVSIPNVKGETEAVITVKSEKGRIFVMGLVPEKKMAIVVHKNGCVEKYEMLTERKIELI